MSESTQQNAKRVLLLDKKATKGPWSVRKDYFDRDEPSQSAAYEVFPHTDGRAKPEDVGEWTALARCNSYEPDNKKNADLIATYRTAAPELARAYLELRQAADGMAAEIEKQPHDPNCAFEHWMSVYACDCWKSKALAAYRAVGEGAPNDTGTSRE